LGEEMGGREVEVSGSVMEWEGWEEKRGEKRRGNRREEKRGKGRRG